MWLCMIYNGHTGEFSISNLKVSLMDHKWSIGSVARGIINGPSGAKGLMNSPAQSTGDAGTASDPDQI